MILTERLANTLVVPQGLLYKEMEAHGLRKYLTVLE